MANDNRLVCSCCKTQPSTGQLVGADTWIRPGRHPGNPQAYKARHRPGLLFWPPKEHSLLLRADTGLSPYEWSGAVPFGDTAYRFATCRHSSSGRLAASTFPSGEGIGAAAPEREGKCKHPRVRRTRNGGCPARGIRLGMKAGLPQRRDHESPGGAAFASVSRHGSANKATIPGPGEPPAGI